MTPGQYRRMSEAFEALVDAPGDQRETLARRACADDPVVLAEVLAMLGVDAGRLHALEHAGAGVAARLAGELTRSELPGVPEHHHPGGRLDIGARLGAYTLVRRLGEGGMGVVYLARQDVPQREVALKVMRPGLWPAQHLQRFRREADILGRLRHPAIAQIYEAGVAYVDSPDGEPTPQPYFAFEYVDGLPLDEHVRTAKLDARAILALIAEIADGVHDAHERGVIHRDLKPSNILVDRAGRPKVLDFGVARADATPGTQRTIVTAPGQIVGTLPYMSPELVGGVGGMGAAAAEIDRRVDVYALGVIAYELLSGRLPLEVSSRSVADAARVIADQVPTRLRSFDTRLRGDIETIVATAMEKDRDRRYASAAALAADIRRFLHNEPIDARPASTLYQLTKFAQRNRGLVGGVAAALLVLLASTVILLILYRDAVAARDDAREATELAVAARDEAKAERDRAETARADATRSAEIAAHNADVADRTAELYRQVFAGLDPSISNGRDTTLLKEMLDRSAQRIARDARIEPAVAGVVLGALGQAYRNIARLGDADTYLTSAHEKLAASLGERNDKTLLVMTHLSMLRQAQGRIPEADALCERVYQLRLEMRGPDDTETHRAMNNLAVLYGATGRPRLALPLLEALLAARRRTAGPNDPASIQIMGNLGNARIEVRGRQRYGLDLLKAAYEGIAAGVGPEHESTMVRLNNYAMALVRGGDAEAGARHLERVSGVLARILEPNHSLALKVAANLGEAYLRLGRFEDAEAACLAVLQRRRAALGDAHPDTRSSIGQLIDIWLKQGRIDEARFVLHATAASDGQLSPADCRRRAELARADADLAGEIAWRELAAASLGHLDPGNASRLSACAEAAQAHLRAGRFEDARRYAEDALTLASDAWIDNDPAVVDLIAALAATIGGQGDPHGADDLFTLGHAMAQLAIDEDEPRGCLRRLTAAYVALLERQGRCEEAAAWAARARHH